jgi:hypothetical protein
MAKFWSSSKITLLTLIFVTAIYSQNLSVASFSRLGFGSRGISMGNAMGSVVYGEVIGYYNPAVLPFVDLRKASITIGILPLDRNLDFLHYTQSLYPTAGFSIFLIRAGVKNIDLRDADGYHIGNHKIAEYLFGFSFSNRVVEKLSLGISLKLYYNDLYQNINSRTLGIDFGLLFKLSENISFSASVHDLNAKYKWDSFVIYREQGRIVTEVFPVTKRFGFSYTIKNVFLASVDFNLVGSERKINFGGEIFPLYFLSEQFKQINQVFCIRGGVEIFDYPYFSLGFGIRRKIGHITLSFDYAYRFERYSPGNIQLLTLGLEI